MKKLFFRIFRKKIDEYRDFSIQKITENKSFAIKIQLKK